MGDPNIPAFGQAHEPARTEHFRIVGHWGPGYHVAPHCSHDGRIFPYLGWSFHTTGELEYLLTSLIEELRDLLRQVGNNPHSGIFENRYPAHARPAPGSHVPSGLALRFFILKRDGYRCQICGRNAQEHGVVLEVDHRIPRAKGGSDDPSNLWILCFDCNRGKSASDL